MPTRMLREGILSSEPVNALSCHAEIFYRRLMSVVDDFGRFFGKPALIRARCYPLQLERVSELDVVKHLAEVCNSKPPLVVVYNVTGKEYLQIINFKQQVRAKKSLFPPPPDSCVSDAQQTLGIDTASVHLGEGEGEGEDVVEGEGGERNLSVSIPTCPHHQIISLYHQHLPMGRQVRQGLWNGTRAKHLQARWREAKERQNLEWWDDFFEHCAKSAFLTGKVAPKAGRTPFSVSLDWLIEPGNFVKVVEGAYD